LREEITNAFLHGQAFSKVDYLTRRIQNEGSASIDDLSMLLQEMDTVSADTPKSLSIKTERSVRFSDELEILPFLEKIQKSNHYSPKLPKKSINRSNSDPRSILKSFNSSNENDLENSGKSNSMGSEEQAKYIDI
jgi:hypothetical protein